jgi:hypothetical protein
LRAPAAGRGRRCSGGVGVLLMASLRHVTLLFSSTAHETGIKATALDHYSQWSHGIKGRARECSFSGREGVINNFE